MDGRCGRLWGGHGWPAPLAAGVALWSATVGVTVAYAEISATGSRALQAAPLPSAGLAPIVLWGALTLLLVQSLVIALLLRDRRRCRARERELAESEQLFRMLAQNSLAGIYLIDEEETVRYANGTLCAMFGYELEALTGKMSFLLLVHPDDRARVAENFGKLLRGLEAPARYEASAVHRNGELMDVEILGSVAVSGGKPVIIGTMLDISKRKRAERRMQQEQLRREELNLTLELRVCEEVEKNREKDRLMLQQSRFVAMGEMIGNIAHQWRQPLNKLGIVMQQMHMDQEKGVMTDRLMEERVGKGMDLLLSLSRTIDDFRNFFRPEKEAALFNLAGAVVKTVIFFAASCIDHNIKVSIDGESDLMHLGHLNEFCQALLNILNNARDAHLERRVDDPLIAVCMRDEERRSVVTIRDNAGGIPSEIIDKIFDPYFTTKEEGRGTGVGLYMAKSIIDRNMQGRISARNLVDGAEFTIVICQSGCPQQDGDKGRAA